MSSRNWFLGLIRPFYSVGAKHTDTLLNTHLLVLRGLSGAFLRFSRVPV